MSNKLVPMSSNDDHRKKQINREISNELMDDFEKFENFVFTHWRKAIYLSFAILILLAAALYAHSHYNKLKATAINTLANATTESELVKAIAAYPNETATPNAMLRLGRIYINEKRYDEALKEFDKIIALNQSTYDSVMRIKLDMAYICELNNQIDQALERFSAISAESTNPLFVTEANYACGRLYVQKGDLVKAAEFLKKDISLDNTQGLFWQEQSRFLNNLIESGYFNAALGPVKK